MRRNARLTTLGVAGALALLTACEPMQISPVLDRRATLASGAKTGGGDLLTVSGTISCTRAEPVDVFPTFSQGVLVDRPAEVSVPCGPGEPQVWRLTFEVDPRFEPGSVRAEIEFCTNPYQPIDEDCVSVARRLDVSAVP